MFYYYLGQNKGYHKYARNLTIKIDAVEERRRYASTMGTVEADLARDWPQDDICLLGD